MKAMIFAAGLGTRLKPLTDTKPKALVPVQGKPLLEHLIIKLKQAGITEAVVNVHHFPEQIRQFLQQHDNFGMDIHISDESNLLLDTGGGVLKAWQFWGDEPFLAHNVDILSNLDLRAFMAVHRPTDLATLVVSPRQTSRYLLFDQAGQLQGWQNTQTGQTKPASLCTDGLQALAFSGIQIISPAIFAYADGLPAKFSVIDLYLRSCSTNRVRAYVPADYRMLDVGKTDSLRVADDFIRG